MVVDTVEIFKKKSNTNTSFEEEEIEMLKHKEIDIISNFKSKSKRYKHIIEAIKAIGVLSLIILLILSLTLASATSRGKKRKDCRQIYSEIAPKNLTICNHTQTFNIPEEYVIAICDHLIEIRRHINQQPSDRGIQLTQRQWEYILNISSYINRALMR